MVETVEHDKILIFSCDTANLFWVPDFFYRLATTEEIEALHRIDRERPISRKRKRKLQKLGKTVYWSKRLESYVYVMGQG